MKEGEKVKVLDLPNVAERNDGIYEEFWKVRDPHIFAKKILDQGEARKYFRSEGLYKELFSKSNDNQKIDFKSKDKFRKYISKKAKNKTIFEVFAQKDIKNIKPKIMCKFIRSIISMKKENLTNNESILVWMQCSGSLDLMRQDQQYYKKILEQKYIDTYEHQIDQDIKRSKGLVSDESHLPALKNIFIAYARRNACIGYCQGFNYIVAKFLQFNMNEEESFWLLVQLLENILPLDYFPSMMMGVVCDQKIFEEILRIKNEKVYKKLMSFEANVLGIFLTQWIVCLFTQALDDSLLVIAWNHLFTKGSITIFKVCLVMINYCKKEILKAKGLEVVQAVEKKLKNWKDTKKFRKKLEEQYINEKGINFMREFYKQICLIQLKQKSEKKTTKFVKVVDYSKIECNRNLPTCQHIIAEENSRDYNEPPEYFIFMTQKQLNFNWDYFKQQKIDQHRNVAIDEDIDIMQTRHFHICKKVQDINLEDIVKTESIIKDEKQQNEQQNIVKDEQQVLLKEQQQQQLQQITQQNNQIEGQSEIKKDKQDENKTKLEQVEIEKQDSQEIFKKIVSSFVYEEDDNSNQQNKDENKDIDNKNNPEPQYQERVEFFKRDDPDLDNSQSYRFFSDITRSRYKFSILIKSRGNYNMSNEIINEEES